MNDSNPALNKAIMRFAYEEYHSGRPRALLSKAIVDPIIADCGEDAMYEHLSDLTDVGFLVLHDIFFYSEIRWRPELWLRATAGGYDHRRWDWFCE